MVTDDTPTLDQALALVQRLSLRDQAHLIERLMVRIGRELELAASVPLPPRSSARSLLSHAGTWVGDDIQARLADVYATRQPVEG